MYLPKDRVTNNHQGYGFVEFRTEEDADYVSDHSSRPSCVLRLLSRCSYPIRMYTLQPGAS